MRISKAFTLPELVTAITITAVIGLAVVGVSVALSKAYANSDNFYQSLQSGRSSMLRLQSEIRKSRLVTAASGGQLVLWMDDLNGDGEINLNEIAVLSYDSASREIRKKQIVFPGWLGQQIIDALNIEIQLNGLVDSVSTILSLFQASNYMQTTAVAADIYSCSFSAVPNPPLSKLIIVDLVAGDNDRNINMRSAVAVRAPLTGSVGVSNGQYVLY